ncbi:PLDc N-terminal domain-containing protein [Allocoprobacillus halotolerans]|uniref:PLDc N-terminal domain-containing protein n=1 Tax=Allocoprobacillus halotolerans TaxID=2944914 RepID=A0ABY5I5R9_9FIRM|nr:PLDc N-terminal domain-containing protein [Allocoprobacillus halotolerans]UTY39719.1 PLDc N-terminal domain-containing protein [Allocoprobacillus halotolerans]
MKIFKIFLNRIVIFGFLIFLQLVWMFFIGRKLWLHHTWIQPLMRAMSLIVVLWLVNKDENPSYKISWIIIVLLFPMFGGLLYLFIGNKKPSRKIRKILQPIIDDMNPEMLLENDVSFTLSESKQDALTYLSDLGYGTYLQTQCRYYALGDYCYGDLLKDLKQAQRYIFMEYFIVSEGLIFQSILDILEKRFKKV